MSFRPQTKKLDYYEPAGEAANGLPSGGTAGQLLSKVDGTDYNATWSDPTAGYTDAEAVAAIKADADWNATDWDTAYDWGDHAGLYEPVDTCLKLDQTIPQTITGGVPVGLEGSYTHKITFNMIGTAGEQAWVQVPYDCTITSYELTADQSGSIVIDLWVDTYANFPPTVADTITASAKPTLSSAQKATDSTLTGWTKTLTAGKYILANVDSASTLEKATLIINVTRS